MTSRRPPPRRVAAYLRVSALGSQIRRMPTTGSPTALSASAISAADGRSDTEPTAYRSPDPHASPSSSVISSENTVVCASARLATA